MAASEPGVKQMTLVDTFARKEPEVCRKNDKYAWKPGHHGLTIGERERLRSQSKLVLFNHFSSSHRDMIINTIADRKPAGFTVEVRKGYALETIVVCGISRAISKRIATEEGNRVIKSIYTAVPSPLGSKSSGASSYHTPILSASEKGKRIHQLVYHKTECLPSHGLLVFSDESNNDCGCLQKLHAREWDNVELYVGDRIFNYLVNTLHLVPIASEFFLWDPSLKMATRVDLLCLTSHMTYVLVSLKTGRHGRDNNPGNTAKFFQAPLDKLPDSIQNRHILQLLLEVMLLTKQYVIPLSDAFILYVHLEEISRNSNSNAPKDVRISIKRATGLAAKLGLTLSEVVTLLGIMMAKVDI